jgi:hypothetical protein
VASTKGTPGCVSVERSDVSTFSLVFRTLAGSRVCAVVSNLVPKISSEGTSETESATRRLARRDRLPVARQGRA